MNKYTKRGIPLIVVFCLVFIAFLLPSCAKAPISSSQIPPPKIEYIPVQSQPEPKLEPGALPSPVVSIPIREEGSTDKTSYASGEKVRITFSIINSIIEPITISPPIEISISKYGLREKIENIRAFTTSDQETVIQGGSKATYEIVWDQIYNDGKQAEPGWYDVNYRYSYAFNESTGTTNDEGFIGRFVVQFPEGQAMNKLIVANKSVTVNDLPLSKDKGKSTNVTMTLERVEFTEEGLKISVLLSSPHYSLGPRGYLDVSHEWIRQPVAEYAIDGVTKPAGPQASNPLAEGMLLEWGIGPYNPIDPVTKDAREFKFTILSYGDWQGPWQFNVPLQ